MTLIASLLFAIALMASAAVIALTFSNAMPRIIEVIDMEFSPAIAVERRITFGEVKGRKVQPIAEVIAFPRKAGLPADFLLAA
ncbi:MAG: hypothetical protein C0429_15850 [Sphingopyxis sp.]|jgi:hypothetical protein|nr:hypothetical protein [Sphingopyxis sp.]